MDKYYVESPGQVVNAFESINYNQREWLMVVRFNGQQFNDLQIRNVLAFYKTNNYITDLSDISEVNSFFGFFTRFIYLIFRFGFKNIYVGCHKSKYLTIFRKWRCPMILLDDGVATLIYHHRLSMNYRKNYVLNYYTYLDLDPIRNGHKIVGNKFSCIKSLSPSNRLQGGAIFYGAKYIEVGIFTMEEYCTYLKKIINILGDVGICYVPHRGEDSSNFEAYKEIGFQIRRTKLPSELDLITMKTKPVLVAGFFTASLLTSKIIYPDLEVISFKFKDKDKEKNKDLEFVYSYYEKFCKVICLDE
ncbi:MAG: hypothetical protein V7749_08750 [Cocleimonas sp.]